MEKTRPQLRTDPWARIAQSSSTAWRTSGGTSESRVRACGATSNRLPRAVSLALVPRNESGQDGPVMAERYRQQLPHAHVHFVDDPNHIVFIDRTDVVTDQLQKFLCTA